LDMAGGSAKKAANIAARKETAAKHQADLARGYNSAMKKLVGQDTVLCMMCGATAMGPNVCTCKGGRTKPSADYDPLDALMASALARKKAEQKEKKKGFAADQSAVQKEREKNREEMKGDSLADPDAVIQGGGNELRQVVEFELSKLGFKIVKNVVGGVSSEGQAAALGVQPGWVIEKVNAKAVPADKKAVEKACQKAMKDCELKFHFRLPAMPEQHYCHGCDAFLAEESFDPDEFDNGPGVQQCRDCAIMGSIE